MASLNLSTNGPSISKSYQSVVNATLPSGSAASPTHGQWAVFSVQAPLVNAFQQDSGNKESVLKVQSTGDGELDDLIEEFSEGRVQFAYVKVTDPNTGLPKNGYHVQITARADGDLTPDGIIQRVGDASGSKYSASSQGPAVTPASNPPPPVASKPAFTPSRSGGIAPAPHPKPSANVDDDGWGDDAPPVTRTQLEKVQPAYQPTRVNLQQLKSENQAPASRQQQQQQPRLRPEAMLMWLVADINPSLKDDRPAPVKGSYEPVGKVDIAAIRARAQKPDDAPEPVKLPERPAAQSPAIERPAAGDSAERLTSLPKPKVANKFGGGPAFGGTKPPLPTGPSSATAAAQIGGASRTFADQGGKTPAQQWAERKAKERGGATPAAEPARPIQSQLSGQPSGGNEWKSSYSGKSWAPVQTVKEKPAPEVADVKSSDPAGTQVAPEPASRVQDTRDQQFDEPAPPPVPQASRPVPAPVPAPAPAPIPVAAPVPLPGLSNEPTETEPEPEEEEHDRQQVLPTPPPQPRSPTPPTPPVRESSPIQVAMPSMQEAVPDERELEEDTQDLGRGAAQATAADHGHGQGGIRAQVQYDYEKAEDNEIELREGEFVTDIEMVDEDWWLGVNARGEHGLFPGNYVELVEGTGQQAQSEPVHQHEPEPEPQPEPQPAAAAVPPPPAPAAAPAASSKGPTATALYDYEAAEDNELTFPENAKIHSVEFPDEDWWLGEYNGKQGLFLPIMSNWMHNCSVW
ncbi:hypothetical protein N7450_011786 [Penicillium hetheringtonii]|uniref:SH3 domain-containing protein n=1 Tax=Penicillium hetheringtonii TaxID=911720 RepID=A0AAD6GNL2_9EURO|nr:hypothetical protein N7450_011786 [Penicillium hetheringtonii]